MTYAIVTFGCRVNLADSFAVERSLRRSGASPGPPECADLVVFNTCSVTAAAEKRARQKIRCVARANPTARIIVTGCYATRHQAALAGLPGVVRVVANDEKERIPEVSGAERDPATGPASAGVGEAGGLVLRPGDHGRTVYPLKIQTGCDESCGYCVIPFTRGRSKSRLVRDVVVEACEAAGAGFKEVMLTGVHLGAYGRDLRPAASLADVLRELDKLQGDVRFRLSSLEPMDCTSEVVSIIAASGRFAPHLHLPLQHASDRMLRAMRRPYTADAIRRLVDDVHARLPDAAIGTDLLVGFPGETDDDGRVCLDFLAHSPLAYAHVFPYSDRPGTAAIAMRPKVEARIASVRADALRECSHRLSRRFAASQVGQTRRALTLGDGATALTDNYLKVRIPPGHGRNEWVEVTIVDARDQVTGLVNS